MPTPEEAQRALMRLYVYSGRRQQALRQYQLLREALQREILGLTRERMVREIGDALDSITAEAALLLMFEDLHWVDDSTLDLISALGRRRPRSTRPSRNPLHASCDSLPHISIATSCFCPSASTASATSTGTLVTRLSIRTRSAIASR